jgi:serine/threonine-protein kinase
MPDHNTASTVPEDRFEQVLANLLQAEERGERLDLSHVVRTFPELETRLRAFFRDRDGFDRLAPQLSPTAKYAGAPLLQPGLPPGSRIGGYEVVEQVGHGGRGIVYKVSDPELNRPLAIKVLRPELLGEPDAVRRFLEEAQVTGQLQHPGIVPLHAIGRLPDGRPYLVMKLVQGRTLAELLAERPAPDHDLPRFLSIFNQVCEAVAYAHSRGGIHRDLKPANVMVGAFAEVQVMDWGLAKVLTANGAGRELARSEPAALAAGNHDTIRTVRTEAIGVSSTDGLIVGTFAYMPPEQARGRVEQLDPRADVFGLGAVLCEVLTGRPPYAGVPAWKVRLMAAAGDLADAFARLDRCGADAELIALAKDCLAPECEHRPGDAGAIAARVATYLTGVQERLRRAERERAAAEARRAEAEAKAKAERQARRLAGGLIAVAFLTVLAVGGAWLWWDRRQAEEHRAVIAELNQVLTAQQKGQWDDARTALERAEARLSGDASPDLRRRIRQGWADLKMVAWIEEARTPQSPLPLSRRTSAGDDASSLPSRLKEGLFDVEQAEADFAEAFQKYGLDLPALDPAMAAERITASPIKEQLLAALDDWAALKWSKDVPGRDHLLMIARQVDSDEWRNRLRDLAVHGDRQSLEELAGQTETAQQSPATLHMLGLALFRVKAYTTATAMLRSAQRQHPGDFWINHDLGFCLTVQPRRSREAAPYFQAALALRPQSRRVRMNLGNALMARGQLAEAESMFRGILRLAPRDARTYSSLGSVLDKQGKREEAIAAFQQAIELQRDLVEAHGNLAVALEAHGKLDHALAAHKKALDLDPNDARLHCNRGVTLEELGSYAEARSAFKKSIHLQANLIEAHLNLGGLLCDRLHDYDAAIASFQKALKYDEGLADAYYGLGNAWAGKGAPAEAIAAYQQAIRLKPSHAWAHCNLGKALAGRGDIPGAIFEYRTALHIQPEYRDALNNLGNALRQGGQVKEAIFQFRQAIKLWPQDGLLHFNLGVALKADGALSQAIIEYRKATQLRPDFDGGWINLAAALRQNRALDDSIEVWNEVIRRFPRRPEGHMGLGNALWEKGLWDEAIVSHENAVCVKPDNALAQMNLGNALAHAGRLAESVAAYQKATRLQPPRADAHYCLGISLAEQGRLEDADAAYRKAIALKPDYAEAFCNMGGVLQRTGHLADSLAAFRRGHELGSRSPRWNNPSLQWLREAERLIALEHRLPEIVGGKLQPANAQERQLFARLCHCKRHYEAATRLYDALLDAAAKETDWGRSDNLYNAACSAALVGCGSGEDATKLDDNQRASRRRQAQDWLRIGLAAWSQFLDYGKPQARASVERAVQHWQADPDLAGVRDNGGLAKLPDMERGAWEEFWANVEALRKRARETK